jgi:hypothetical protein
MIITIQSINNRFVISQVIRLTSFKSLNNATRFAGAMANAVQKFRGERSTITVLPIKHTPMATKKTYPAKKKAVVAKKKVVAKGKKK